MQNIILEIRSGDREAFREFFEDYYPVLCSFARKYLFDTERCRDIAQEALLTYWEERGRFLDLSEARRFLYTVTRNACFNVLKKERAADRYLQASGQEYADDFEEKIIEHEVFLLLHKAVNGLPTQMRRIIEYSLQGMRNSEIAREIGIAEGTLHTLKKRAYRKLREAMKDHFYVLLFF
ncbi:MAG: sigma-70 family RNA polymerase sigma factor [Odoribacteraceae bacterium]|nr:sigma-70 family RNA polymerase sigma factor [Odoribacteraceae bacterium]